MLGAKLGYFQASVAHVDNGLLHAFHLVSQDDGVAFVSMGIVGAHLAEHRLYVLQLGGVLHLLHAPHEEALVMELTHRVLGVLEVTPVDAVLASKRRLVYLRVGRAGRDAAKVDALNAESVAATEHTAYVIERPDIVEHHDERQLVGFLELLHRQAVHLYGSEFAHN